MKEYRRQKREKRKEKLLRAASTNSLSTRATGEQVQNVPLPASVPFSTNIEELEFLTKEQITTFQRDGILVIEGILDLKEIEAAREG